MLRRVYQRNIHRLEATVTDYFMPRKRGNPNWLRPAAIRGPLARAASFDKVIEELSLQPADFAASDALKEWARLNKDDKYVPSDLLEAWGFQVKTAF